MPKYKKASENPGKVYIPGNGWLAAGEVLEGDFDRFVPHMLVEVAEIEETSAVPVVVPAEKLEAVTVPTKEDIVAELAKRVASKKKIK